MPSDTPNKDQLLIREKVDGAVVKEYELDEIDTPVAPSPRTRARTRRTSGAEAEMSLNPTGATSTRKSASRTRIPAVSNFKNDKFIWGIYLALLAISVVELYSASSTEVTASNVYGPLIRHGKFLVIGLLIALGLQRVHYATLKHFAMPVAVLSAALLLYSTFFGVVINGAQRAIHIAGFTIQPPEIVKLTVIIWLAKILGSSQEGRGVKLGAVWKVAGIVLFFSAILWKNGLTNTILLMGVSLCMMLIGGIQLKRIFCVIAVYGIFGGMLFVTKYSGNEADEFNKSQTEQTVASTAEATTVSDRSDTHKGRISRFLAGDKPTDDITDDNRQSMMAKFAQANGGVFGHGPGKSRETARLPLAFSDYIYSIIIEDTGLIGGLALLTLYLLLLGRAGRVAFKCRRAFPAFLIMGCAVLIVFQALVHMAIVSGVVPVSGQPLPFISKGGTSVIVMSTAIGIMLSVSRHAVRADVSNRNDVKAEDAQLSPELHTANASTL